MKKYISPEIVVVELHTSKVVMQATSMELWGDEEIGQDTEILTKDYISSKNTWDEEWQIVSCHLIEKCYIAYEAVGYPAALLVVSGQRLVVSGQRLANNLSTKL